MEVRSMRELSRSWEYIAVGLAAVTMGCGSPILRANFESDALGSVPAPELPGDPVGDTFYLSSPTSGSVVVVAAPAGLTGRSLNYRHNVPTSYSRFVGFMGKETSPSVQQFWAIWNGVPQLTDQVPLDIWIGDGHFQSFGAIRLQGGQVLVANDTTGRNFSPIGAYTPGRMHTVLMKVDKPSSSYVISVLGGPTSVTTGTRPVLTPSALTATRPVVYFWYPSDGTSTSTYTIDNMLMTEACPTDRGEVGSCP